MSGESKDCLQCRLTSGGGLLAGSIYVIYQSKKIKTSSRHVITAIGYGLGLLGILRLFGISPFRSTNLVEKRNIENGDENDYIIGKLPPKLQ